MAEFISKNRIFDLIHAVYSVHGFTSYEDYVGLLKDVETSTNADVRVVKHGRWFHINDEGIVYCSECNNEAYWDTDYGQQLFDYCPYCGAKMTKDGDKK